MSKDFNKWLIGRPDWMEISHQYNTGQYQHKQDLIAVFWNAFTYFEQKLDKYFRKYQIIPHSIFDELIYEFRQHFPKSGRIDGINYFDDLIENLIGKYTTKKQKPSANKTSYVWENNPDTELPELYNLMINKYKLIVPETTNEQFKAIFTGQPIDDVQPIKWHQDNASELLYFINRLEQSNNIVHKTKNADYQKMTACFVKPDGQAFNAVWKSLKTNIDINLSQDKQKAIDELMRNF